MTAVARLVAFAAVLAVVFAGAALLGDTLDPEASTAGKAAHGEPGPARADAQGTHAEPAAGGDRAAASAEVEGLAVSDDGFTLEPAVTRLPAGREAPLEFSILTADGSVLERFEVEQERRMHLIVVRRDLTGFQHLHPELDRDGTWRIPIRLPEPGSYRMFADFKTGGEVRTLAADLAVDGDARLRKLPESKPLADAGEGYQVRLDSDEVRAGEAAELRFVVHKDGRAVRVEPYLGADGHLTALREGDLAFLHTHPAGADHGDGADGEDIEAPDEAIRFDAEFPSAGRYRLYLQFRVQGEVRTAEFTQEVGR